MIQKITSTLLGLSLLLAQVPLAFAATNPTVTYNLDCQTADRTVEVGFVSDPTTPSAGPQIIAFRLVLQLIPSVSTTVSDLKGVTVQPNQTKYSKLIVAENEVQEEQTLVKVTIAGGFTNNEGLAQVDDLIFLKGIGDKTYRIKVLDGEMYEKGNTNNIFNVPSDFFSVDPSTCSSSSSTNTANTTNTNTSTSTSTSTSTAQTGQQSVSIDNQAFSPQNLTVAVGTQVVWTNNDSTPHTVTSANGIPLNSGTLSPGRSYRHTFTEAGTFTYTCNIHPSMTGTITVTGSGSTGTTASTTSTTTSSTNASQTTPSQASTDQITLSADKATPAAGETVVVTALIKNRGTNSIDWTQTAGAQIQPQINNEDQADGTTKSELTFQMPAESIDLVLAVKVGSETKSITIPGTVLRNSADTTTGVQDDAASLQERLAQRRAEQQAAAEAQANTQPTSTQTAGNVHASAGGLASSGPAETGLLIMTSILLVLGWTRARKALEV